MRPETAADRIAEDRLPELRALLSRLLEDRRRSFAAVGGGKKL